MLKLSVLLFLTSTVRSLSQEVRLQPQFCDYKEPLPFFSSSITNLSDVYEYLVPKPDENETLDTTMSQVRN